MKTLVEKLRRHWEQWGSPASEDEGVNERVMAFHCKEAADEIERLQQSKSDSRWIPRDRAPERGGDEVYYIVRRIWKPDGSELSPAVAWWDMFDKEWRLMPDEGWPEADEEITHWMPVPESPSEVHKPGPSVCELVRQRIREHDALNGDVPSEEC